MMQTGLCDMEQLNTVHTGYGHSIKATFPYPPQIAFEGVVNEYSGDIALDDISLVAGKCPRSRKFKTRLFV